MILVSLAALPIMMSAARVSRVEGVMLVAAYLAYLAGLFFVVPQWMA
jgi:Ca2+/H+ antiporter